MVYVLYRSNATGIPSLVDKQVLIVLSYLCICGRDENPRVQEEKDRRIMTVSVLDYLF